MRRLVIAMLSAALVTAAAAGADAAATAPQRTHVTVSPRTGTPSTRFRVRFTSPEQTGTLPGLRVWETVVVSGPWSTGACDGAASARMHPASAHARLSVRLAPAGKRWCPGSYRGAVNLYREVRCPPGPITQHRVCPVIAFTPQRLGQFRFTVRRSQR